jgi:hypothetical protein
VTYQEDKEATRKNIERLIIGGEYPEKLWS